MTEGSDGTVTCHRAGDVLRVVLDRPGRRNAVSSDMVRVLVEVLEEAAVDDGLRVLVLEGAGSDFCAGYDWVSTNEPGERPRVAHLTRRTPLKAHRVIQLLHDIQLPVVCVVRGWAAGFGLGMALAADFTVACRSAVFWAPFARRGFTPDSGGSWLLPRLIGIARAKDLLMLGRQLSGAEAAELGMIHDAVEDADLDPTATALVEQLGSGPTVALGLTKQAIHAATGRSLTEALFEETVALELACRTRDFKEGLDAFVERREPEFRGR